jgi:hypothetical protein
MSDTSVTEAAPAPELPADTPPTFASVSEAARFLSKSRGPKETAESAPTATAEPELAQEANASPETVPGETQAAEPEEKLPPVERPRSWSQDDDEEWNALPRARQEKIATNERAREADISRRINEATEKTKAVEAKVKEAEQVKQEYHGKLSEVMQTLLDQNNQQFSAIKSQADLDYLANEAVRLSNAGNLAESQQITAYLSSWQLHQSKMAGVKADLDKANSEKSQKQFSEWNSHAAKENNLAKEAIPDLEDPEKNKAFYKYAVDRMKELKFTEEEIADLANGKQMLSIHDHRLQQLLWADHQLTSIKKAKAAVPVKDVPPVQRPGTPAARNASGAQKIQDLQKRVSNASGLEAIRLGAELLRAQRSA